MLIRMSSSVCVVSLGLLSGCSSGSSGGHVHSSAEPSAVPAKSFTAEPIAADTATLTVHGLSCPQCASNLTLTLEEVGGVDTARMDLGTGAVTVTFGLIHPSGEQLAIAVEDAGFTLVEIRTN